MLNRWTYGWLGRSVAPELPDSPSTAASFRTALDNRTADARFPGSWLEDSDVMGRGRQSPTGQSPAAATQTLSSPPTPLHPAVNKVTRSELDSQHARPESLRPTPPLGSPAVVSQNTMSRLKAQLARAASPPLRPLPENATRRFIAQQEDPSASPLLSPRRPCPQLRTLSPPESPRPLGPGFGGTISSPDQLIARGEEIWESEWEKLTESGFGQKSEGERILAQAGISPGATSSQRFLPSERLPDIAERVVLEGTLLIPPPTFTSLSEIGKLSPSHWIPYSATLTTKSLYFHVPSSSSSSSPSDQSIKVLALSDCDLLDQPPELPDQPPSLYTFAVTVTLDKGEKDERCFGTKTAKEWLSWTTTVRELIDLRNGRAPIDLSRMSTRRTREAHLEELEKIANELEGTARGGGRGGRDAIEGKSREILGTDNGKARKSRLRKEARKSEFPTGEPRGKRYFDNRTEKESPNRERSYRGPSPEELLELLREQQNHLEQCRQFERDQSKALASFVRDIRSSSQSGSLEDNVVRRAITMLKEARQAQDTVLSTVRDDVFDRKKDETEPKPLARKLSKRKT